MLTSAIRTATIRTAAVVTAGILLSAAPAKAETVEELIDTLIGPYQSTANKHVLLPFKANAVNFATANGFYRKPAVRETARFTYNPLFLQMKFEIGRDSSGNPQYKELHCVSDGCRMY